MANNARSLSGVIAHEITHLLIRKKFGYWRNLTMPTWKKEGYAEYVAGGSTLPYLRRSNRPLLLARVDELDAVALILEAEREVEPLPTVVLTLILTRRQRCEGYVAHPAKAGHSQKP